MNANILISTAVHDQMRAIAKGRSRPGKPVHVCTVYEEFVKAGLELDRQKAAQPATEPAGGIVLVANLPLFQYSPFASDDMLREAMDKSRRMVWMSGPDGGWLHVNPVLVRSTGRPVSQWLGSGWKEAIKVDTREACLQHAATYIQNRQPFRNFYEMQFADGFFNTVLDYAQPRLAPDGCFGGYIGTIVEAPMLSPGSQVELLWHNGTGWLSKYLTLR